MTSPKTLTKSPTLVLNNEQRERLIELVTLRYLDRMDLRDLERFFLDVQSEYLSLYSDEELLSEVDDVTLDDEYEEIVNEIAA